MGRLPALMGQPAGGSLTADQWLIAATVVCPIAVRLKQLRVHSFTLAVLAPANMG